MYRALLIQTQLPGVNWYRGQSFINNFKGIEATCWPPYSSNTIPNWQEVLEGKIDIVYELEKEWARSNIIVCQRIRSGIAFATLMGMKEKYPKKIFCEIDDDAFNVDASNPGFVSVRPDSDGQYWFRKQLEVANGVIVSTEHLKKVYQTINKNIYVIPNSIDFRIWDNLRKKKNDKLTIGWQGGLAHFKDLQILTGVIPKILNKYKDVVFHLFGCEFDYLKMNGVEFSPQVAVDKYPKELAKKGFDILLAPLQDTFFNRSKSNLRVIEAGALKLPVIASAGKKLPYEQTITDRVDGLLCTRGREWVRAISELIENKDLREKLGFALYQNVKKNYNIKDTAKRYEAVLKEG